MFALLKLRELALLISKTSIYYAVYNNTKY